MDDQNPRRPEAAGDPASDPSGRPSPSPSGRPPPDPPGRPPSDPASIDGEGGPHDVPLGQRLFDRPFLLLAVGLLVMAVFYTAWGLWEMTSLTPAPLP